MIFATVAGNLGKDASIRQAGNTPVCSFGVATEAKVKGEKKTTWVNCSLFGKRGEAICQHLTKGTRVAVVGRLSQREHNGKTYLELDVSEITLLGGGQKDGGGVGGGSSKSNGGGYDDADYGAGSSGGGDTDDLPF